MTSSELQAKIIEILELIEALQEQFLQLQGVSEIPSQFKFKLKLKIGEKSDDVKYLQIFLKAQGVDIYPEGLVTGNFGPLTKKAVIKFQEKYKGEILLPLGLTQGTGIVGQATIAKINLFLSK